jgi:mannosyltransferase OCH1-like enzyme
MDNLIRLYDVVCPRTVSQISDQILQPQNFAVRGSDIGRYCVMHQQGGIYADLDYEAVVIQKK